MAVTAYLPRVFNSTTPASKSRYVWSNSTALALDTPARAMRHGLADGSGSKHTALGSFELF
jgi:hypothetical protein